MYNRDCLNGNVRWEMKTERDVTEQIETEWPSLDCFRDVYSAASL